jgi:dTMP kinase
MAATGRFIILEGGEGAGKDTQMELLKQALPEGAFVFTREPGGTALGKRLREILLESENVVTNETEALLFLADRAQHMAEMVRPSVEHGLHVISNRSWVSLIAYQIYGRGRRDMLPFISAAHELVYKEVKPDLIIYLDISPEESARRVQERGNGKDTMERNDPDFFGRVRAGFIETLKGEPAALALDATRSREDLHAEILGKIRTLTNDA